MIKWIFRWALRRLDMFEQIAVKRALRKFVDEPLDVTEHGHELMKDYTSELLKYINKGELLKF